MVATPLPITFVVERLLHSITASEPPSPWTVGDEQPLAEYGQSCIGFTIVGVLGEHVTKTSLLASSANQSIDKRVGRRASSEPKSGDGVLGETTPAVKPVPRGSTSVSSASTTVIGETSNEAFRCVGRLQVIGSALSSTSVGGGGIEQSSDAQRVAFETHTVFTYLTRSLS